MKRLTHSERNRRSAPPFGRFQNRHALHMMRHRKGVGPSGSQKSPGQNLFLDSSSFMRTPGTSNERHADKTATPRNSPPAHHFATALLQQPWHATPGCAPAHDHPPSDQVGRPSPGLDAHDRARQPRITTAARSADAEPAPQARSFRAPAEGVSQAGPALRRRPAGLRVWSQAGRAASAATARSTAGAAAASQLPGGTTTAALNSANKPSPWESPPRSHPRRAAIERCRVPRRPGREWRPGCG